MRAHNGTHRAKLHPARVHFGVNAVDAAHVSAEVVAPIAIEHIRGSVVEVGLEVERLPRDNGITRESHLIAVVAESAPAVIYHRSLLSVLLHIGEEAAACPPSVLQRGELAVVDVLLPVEPPEIHAVSHHRVEYFVEHRGHELLVAAEPVDALLRCRVHTHGACHLGIFLLIPIHTVGRVQVEGNLQVVVIEVFEQTAVVGEKLLVPGPACPATTVLLGVVPVHINHEHIKGEAIVAQVFGKIAHLLVGVEPVARPPVAESIARRQRHLPCKARIVLQSTLIVGAIGHEVPVLSVGVLSLGHPLPLWVTVEEQAL